MTESTVPAVRKPHPRALSASAQLLPNGSIIHWTEMYQVRVPYPKACVPVTCGNPWGNPNCRGKRDVRVVRGLSEPVPLSPYCLSTEEQEFRGLCNSCFQRKNHANQTLPSGTRVLWREMTAEGVPIICGKCGKRWYLKNGHYPYKGTGYCADCRNGRRSHDEVHPSGTIIHWGRRHPEENTLVAITCHQCGNKEEPEKFAWHSQVTDPNWSGRCTKCNRQIPPHNKLIHDELVASGSIIHWAERDPNDPSRVMVSCGLCKRAGKETKRLMHSSAYRKWKVSKRAGHCQEHYADPEALLALLTAKPAPGPEKEQKSIITERSLREAFRSLGKFAPQEAVAEFLGVEARSIRLFQQARGVSYAELRRRLSDTGSTQQEVTSGEPEVLGRE